MCSDRSESPLDGAGGAVMPTTEAAATRAACPVAPSSAGVAGEKADHNVEAADDAANDGHDDATDAVDDGHDALSDSAEDGRDAGDDGTHFC